MPNRFRKLKNTPFVLPIGHSVIPQNIGTLPAVFDIVSVILSFLDNKSRSTFTLSCFSMLVLLRKQWATNGLVWLPPLFFQKNWIERAVSSLPPHIAITEKEISYLIAWRDVVVGASANDLLNHMIIVWNKNTDKLSKCVFHSIGIHDVALFGDHLVIATHRGAEFFDSPEALLAGRRNNLIPHRDLRCMVVSDDQTCLVMGDAHGRCVLLKFFNDSVERFVFWNDRFPSEVKSIAISPDNKKIVYLNENNQIILIDIACNKIIPRQWPSHFGSNYAVRSSKTPIRFLDSQRVLVFGLSVKLYEMSLSCCALIRSYASPIHPAYKQFYHQAVLAPFQDTHFIIAISERIPCSLSQLHDGYGGFNCDYYASIKNDAMKLSKFVTCFKNTVAAPNLFIWNASSGEKIFLTNLSPHKKRMVEIFALSDAHIADLLKFGECDCELRETLMTTILTALSFDINSGTLRVGFSNGAVASYQLSTFIPEPEAEDKRRVMCL